MRLAVKEKMMSSSDDQNKPNEAWSPLVPSDLDKYDKESSQDSDMSDPDAERAFKALYDNEAVEPEEKGFSFLYRTEEDKPEETKEDLKAEPAQDPPPVETPEDLTPKVPLPDVEEITRKAYDEGFAKGEADGEAKGLEKSREMIVHLEKLTMEIELLWNRMVKNYEKQIIELTMKITENVVYGISEKDNEIITRSIIEAFNLIPEPEIATITVNPADYEYIEVVKEDFFENIRGLKQVSIVSDPIIPPGGCKIETESGEVDTSIQKRLELVKQAVLEHYSP